MYTIYSLKTEKPTSES